MWVIMLAVVLHIIMSINMWWETKVAGNNFFWRLPWLKAGVSGRSQAGPSCGGCACVTSSSPWAHRGVKPGEAEVKGHQVEVINKPQVNPLLVLAHFSQRNFLFLTLETSETWSRNHMGVFWHMGSGNWWQIGKFWWVCIRSCLWFALWVQTGVGKRWEHLEFTYLWQKKEIDRDRERERESIEQLWAHIRAARVCYCVCLSSSDVLLQAQASGPAFRPNYGKLSHLYYIDNLTTVKLPSPHDWGSTQQRVWGLVFLFHWLGRICRSKYD